MATWREVLWDSLSAGEKMTLCLVLAVGAAVITAVLAGAFGS